MNKYIKTKYNVTFKRVLPGTTFHNFLENNDYSTTEDRCIVITGTVGEMWPVTFEKLNNVYDLISIGIFCLDDIPLNKEITVCTKDPNSSNYIYAELLSEPTIILTGHGDKLNAQAGDYKVYSVLPDGSPNVNDCWSVNGQVFKNTYKLMTETEN